LRAVAHGGKAKRMSLPRLLATVEFDADTLSADVTADWLQGRTTYGGLSAAIALHAAKAAFPDLPPLRSVQAAFVGPLAGTVSATPVLLRRGKNSAFIDCTLTNTDGVGLRALLLFMARRESAIAFKGPATPDFPISDERIDADKVPQGFLGNFDFAPWHAENGTVRRWIRLNERDGLDPETELVCIADALPPAAMTLAKSWGPISTTTWQLNLLTETPHTDDGWWLLEAKTLYAGDGNSSQSMTIWNRNGSPVATATQSVALFI
jgi:Thioesterase-like superfamily